MLNLAFETECTTRYPKWYFHLDRHFHLDDAWLYGVHRTCRGGGSFMWHQPCQCCKYTTFIKKDYYYFLNELKQQQQKTESRASGLRDRRIALYKSDQHTHLSTKIAGKCHIVVTLGKIANVFMVTNLKQNEAQSARAESTHKCTT